MVIQCAIRKVSENLILTLSVLMTQACLMFKEAV